MVLASIYDYQAIPWLIGIVVVMAGAMFGAAHLLGPRRMGPSKGLPYEAGMLPMGTTWSRFDIRFYRVAIIFLIFDIEVALLWPWASIFADSTRPDPRHAGTVAMREAGMGGGYLFAVAGIFVLLLLFGFVYDWRKRALEFS